MASTSSQHRPRRPVPAPSNHVLLESQKQWYFTDEELTRTPSLLDGMSADTEHIQRSKGVNFIVQVGMILKLPQLTLNTAAVFMHRFFVRYSMVDLPRRPGLHPYSVAAGCLFLASKVDENCRKIRELVIACCRVAQKNPNLEVDEQNKEFWKWKDTLLAYEDLCLEALCFDLQLEQPHKICYEFLCYFGKNDHKPLRNAAWAFLNDSNFTVLCLQFYPRTIAAAALWAGARLCDVAFEDDEQGSPWWEQIDVNLTEVRRAVSRMVQLYEKNTVHRQSHQYPTNSTDSDGNSETTRIVNPHPSSIPESIPDEGEINGRKRSREAEDNISPPHSATKNHSSFGNNSREPSPKRQRLTPDPSRTPAESSQKTLSSSSSLTQNGLHQLPRSNSRIPSAAFDQNRRQQHPLPPPPPPAPADTRDKSNGTSNNHNNSHGGQFTDSADVVQQRIDEIVQQGLRGSSRNNNHNYHHAEHDRDRDRYRDHNKYRDRDREWDPSSSRRDRDGGGGGGRHRADSYEHGNYRDHDRDRGRDYYRDNDRRPSTAATNTSSTSSDNRMRLSAEPAAAAFLPTRPSPSHSRSFSRINPSHRKREGDDEEGNEEGEINSDREEGEVTSTNPPSAHKNDEDEGGGSEEGEV